MRFLGLKIGVLLVVAGCGGGDPASIDRLDRFVREVSEEARSAAFEMPCIGSVTADEPVHVKAFASNIQLARDLLDKAGLIPKAEFCATFEGVHVHIKSVYYWRDEFWGQRAGGGSYNYFDKITLGRSGSKLVHEFLHHWDTIHLQVANSSHLYWDKNGYDWVSQVFERLAQPVTDPENES